LGLSHYTGYRYDGGIARVPIDLITGTAANYLIAANFPNGRELIKSIREFRVYSRGPNFKGKSGLPGRSSFKKILNSSHRNIASRATLPHVSSLEPRVGSRFNSL
jgi:hypothetical protein